MGTDYQNALTIYVKIWYNSNNLKCEMDELIFGYSEKILFDFYLGGNEGFHLQTYKRR